MERFDITIQMLGVEASGPQYVWEKVPAEEGELVLYTDAQATIAALQAALDSERAQSLRHVEEAMNLRAQLTQRTAECDALKLVNDTHMKTVMKLSHVVEQRTAELEAANTRVMDERNLSNSWMKKHDELLAKVHKSGQFGAVVVQDVLKERDTLQAELERVRSLIKALPKVEGELTCSQQFDSAWRIQYWQVEAYGVADECLYRLSNLRKEEANAYAALLQHRQGMEG